MMICTLIWFWLSQDKKHEKIMIVASIVLAFSMRKDACLMLLPFFIPIGLLKSYHDKEMLIKCFKLAFEIIGALTIVVISNQIIDSVTGWSNYNEYNVIRTKYYDYYQEDIKNLTEAERKELLEKVGISDTEFAIMDLYYVRTGRGIARKDCKFSRKI